MSAFNAKADFEQQRARMVERHLVRRGIRDANVLQAFRAVPREDFLPKGLIGLAYEDGPLPIGEEQTISQPYIVAFTMEALKLDGHERVLEVGTGSGYAAAILSRLAKEVLTIERIESLAKTARERLGRLGYDNVEVVLGDGTLGIPERAPYDAIAVAAGGPKPPAALMAQLAIGGRLVIPIGTADEKQQLIRVTRLNETDFRREVLADVRFVPLIGAQGWSESETENETNENNENENESVFEKSNNNNNKNGAGGPHAPLLLTAPTSPAPETTTGLIALVRECAERIDDIDTASIDALIERVGDARVVLIGEASHGTSEFYRMRARITKELIARRGFNFVSVEADWPDAARIDDYVIGGARRSKVDFKPFARFPQWMWRNEEVHDFVDWLRAFNADASSSDSKNKSNSNLPRRPVGFHGLDLYSLFTSIAAVLSYLDEVDPDAARVARHRYAALTPWQRDPAEYGKAVLVGRYKSSEQAVVDMLRDMLEKRFDYARRDGDRFFDAAQNARLVANAERYYRSMYYGGAASWNLRDAHMFDTLRTLLAFYGPASKGIVWEHNSHVGDATATEMSSRGEHNVGEMCRDTFGPQAYIIGFGTDHGTVAAASDWGAPMQRMRVRPAARDSYERLFHEVDIPAFMLHLREPRRAALRDELLGARLERAIGVIYRPDTELLSHYFYASLPLQFDEYVWFDETRAVAPLPDAPEEDTNAQRIRALGGRLLESGVEVLPDTYPFGL